MTENADVDTSVILPELMPTSLFSGPCFGDVTPSESSQTAVWDQTDVLSLSLSSDETLIESIPNDVDVTDAKDRSLQVSVRSRDLTSNAYALNGEQIEQMSISAPLTSETAILNSQPLMNHLPPLAHPDAQSITPAALTDLSPDRHAAIFDAELRPPKPSTSVQLSDTSSTAKDSLDPTVESSVDNDTFALSVQDSRPTEMRHDSDTSICIEELPRTSEAATELPSSLPASLTRVEDRTSCCERTLVSLFLADDSRDVDLGAKLDDLDLPYSSPPSSSPPLFSSPPRPSSQTTAPEDDYLVPYDSVQTFLNGNPQSLDQPEKINDTNQFDTPANRDVDLVIGKLEEPLAEPVPTLHTKTAADGLCEQNPHPPLPSHLSNLPTDEVEINKGDSGEDEVLSTRYMEIGKVVGVALEQENLARPSPTPSTVTSQEAQHDKLRAPFRSPLMKRAQFGMSAVDVERETKPEIRKEMTSAESSKPTTCPEGASSDISPLQTKQRNHTQRAASQFKSPLSATASSNLISSVRLTPAIQAMERKVQILRRAVKVKKENEAEILEDLASKWTEAGREVAWEVWNLIKENDAGTATSWGGNKRNFQDSWGWDEGAEAKRHKSDKKSWGWDMPDDEHTIEDKRANEDNDYCEEVTEDTMGTMLRQLGIFPETLGWCEIEGSFVDS